MMESKETVLYNTDTLFTDNDLDYDEGGGFTTKSVVDALVRQAEISFKVGIKEMMEFKCDECATPGFVHLIIPVKKLQEWGLDA